MYPKKNNTIKNAQQPHQDRRRDLRRTASARSLAGAAYAERYATKKYLVNTHRTVVSRKIHIGQLHERNYQLASRNRTPCK